MCRVFRAFGIRGKAVSGTCGGLGSLFFRVFQLLQMTSETLICWFRCGLFMDGGSVFNLGFGMRGSRKLEPCADSAFCRISPRHCLRRNPYVPLAGHDRELGDISLCTRWHTSGLECCRFSCLFDDCHRHLLLVKGFYTPPQSEYGILGTQ